MKDSLGNELTKEQEIFFKDSKIRDEKGNLLVLHHGSPVKNIKIFKEDDDYGNFFTTNLNYAKEYAKDQETEIIGTIYDVYLNIKNPLHINSEEAKEIYKDKAKTLTQATDIVYNHIRQNRQLGYDGIIASEEISDDNKRKYGEDADISYIPLDANQVKATTNKIPTNSKDINERLNNMFTEVKTKQVYDSDGFLTDYTMYKDEDGNYIFIFGDRDFYTPDNTDPDWEIEASGNAEKLADEWFENYEGFEEQDDFPGVDDDDLYEAKEIYKDRAKNINTSNRHFQKNINERLNNMYKKIKTKTVEDSHGFVDEYTMYEDDAGNYIFILGDPDFETPDNTKPDHEIKAGNEAKKLAYEWWKNYGTPKATVDSSDEDDREAEKHKKSRDLAKRIFNDLEDFFKTEDFEDEAYFNEYDRDAFGDTYDALSNYLTSEGY